ncbi:MAG: ergothioneine biosynthesis protein EgtC [Cyanobacteria bacterium P01_D01_bin.123]
MCRLIAYVGPDVPLARVVSDPEHSLVVQSYQPQEMTRGLLNADGFGVGWYSAHLNEPCLYANTLPIWNDVNLPRLGKHVRSPLIFASVRSATPGLAVDLSNCQPYTHNRWMGMHNGYIENFRHTLMRPIRQTLRDDYYRAVLGSTDSEHLFALWLHYRHGLPETLASMREALHRTLAQIATWMQEDRLQASLNLLFTDGNTLVASRFALHTPAPTLYYASDDPAFPHAVVVASEPPYGGDRWHAVPDGTILSVDEHQNVSIERLTVETRPLAS